MEVRKLLRLLLIEVVLQSLIVLIVAQDDEPSIPSRMPSPKKPATPPRGPRANEGGEGRPGGGGGGGVNNGLRPGSVLPLPPPQNTPESPAPHPPVPFGLRHIILILVPQFKTKIQNLPKWMGASAKVSLPITVFFDKLKVPQPTPGPISPSPFYGPYFPGGHFVKKRNVVDELERNMHMGSDSGKNPPKRPSLNEGIYRAERVMLIPKLEKLLKSFGLGGKPCLLRAICEIHEVPLQHHGYGLLGEVLTLFFSISRSAFADSHLSEYTRAEEVGKLGDCSEYSKSCSSSIFYWERINSGLNQSAVEDEEFDFLDQFI